MRNLLLLALPLAACLAGAQTPRLILDPSTDANGLSIFSPSDLNTQLSARLVQEANRTIGRPLEDYSLAQNSLLTTSRDVLANIINTALAYRTTGDLKYRDYARRQLLESASYPNWAPNHFLGTAEMTLAMSIGYDWLGQTLSKEDRATIRKAIVEKGLVPGLEQFKNKADWTRTSTNWSQVCGSSLAMGAIAIQDDDKAMAQRVLNLAVPCVKRASSQYAKGGIPSEGPVYWRYGMAFQTMLNRTMINRFGKAQTVLGSSAFNKTAWYPVYVLGTSGKNFNFGDASDWFVPTPATLELARQTKQPMVAAWTDARVRELLLDPQPWTDEHRLSALFLPWAMSTPELDASNLPLDRLFDGDCDIVSMRGSWTDPMASFVGIKGGKNGVPHGQLDLGSFVFDALGERWAMDLGKDDYDLPGYFGAQRNTYFRNGTIGQNTIYTGANQRANGSASLSTKLNIASPWAAVDLTKGYTAAKSIVRRFEFPNRRDLIITDTVQRASGMWRWQMVTAADVVLNGKTALLTLNGKKLLAEILSEDGEFSVATTKPGLAIEDQNEGTQLLCVMMPPGTATLQVALRPQ